MRHALLFIPCVIQVCGIYMSFMLIRNNMLKLFIRIQLIQHIVEWVSLYSQCTYCTWTDGKQIIKKKNGKVMMRK